MRVSEETLSHNWMGIGWWVSRLLVGASNTTHQQHNMSLVSDACQRRNLESWLGGNGLVSEWVLVGASSNTHQQHFLVQTCVSAQKTFIVVVGCARGGGV